MQVEHLEIKNLTNDIKKIIYSKIELQVTTSKLYLAVLMLVVVLQYGCAENTEKKCYEAKRAVAETTEKYQAAIEAGENSEFWGQAMYSAVAWRSKACPN